jgi:hypothetical protein
MQCASRDFFLCRYRLAQARDLARNEIPMLAMRKSCVAASGIRRSSQRSGPPHTV